MNIIEEIRKRKIVAIVRGVKSDDMISLADALTEGGITLIEVTFDQRSKEGIQETMKSLSRIKEDNSDCREFIVVYTLEACFIFVV